MVRIGFLAARANLVPGSRNIRGPNRGQLAPNLVRYDSEDRILGAEWVRQNRPDFWSALG